MRKNTGKKLPASIEKSIVRAFSRLAKVFTSELYTPENPLSCEITSYGSEKAVEITFDFGVFASGGWCYVGHSRECAHNLYRSIVQGVSFVHARMDDNFIAPRGRTDQQNFPAMTLVFLCNEETVAQLDALRVKLAGDALEKTLTTAFDRAVQVLGDRCYDLSPEETIAVASRATGFVGGALQNLPKKAAIRR